MTVMLPVASADAVTRSKSTGSGGSFRANWLTRCPVDKSSPPPGVCRQSMRAPSGAREEGVWHVAREQPRPRPTRSFGLTAVDVQDHRPGQDVEGLLRPGMGVEGGALARLDRVLEEQEAAADLGFAHQPGVHPAAVEPATLGVLGVAHAVTCCS